MTDAPFDEDAENHRIGARLQAHRLALELSVAELAGMAGLDEAAIHAYEGGAVLTPPRLRALATALEVQVDDLLDRPAQAWPSRALAEASLAHDYLLAMPDPRLRRAALAMLASLTSA